MKMSDISISDLFRDVIEMIRKCCWLKIKTVSNKNIKVYNNNLMLSL